MTSAPGLNLVTGGLLQGSGLSLTSDGLLLISATGTGSLPLVDTEAPPQKIDVELEFSVELLDADVGVDAGDLISESSLRSAILLSLFTDSRATAEELASFGAEDPRGWSLDHLSEIEGDAWGSRLWLLRREKQTDETLARATEYSRTALRWLIEDGIASDVLVTASYPARSQIAIEVEIVRPSEPSERYAFVWEI